MEVQPASQGIASPPSEVSLSTGAVTQDAFLQLLIVQLQNQDPLDPLDNQEFIAQLATFNSLDQLASINKKMDVVQAGQLMLGQLGTTSLIGKEVTAQGNSVSLGEAGGAEIHYNLAAEATRVVVNITDSEGNLVNALEVGSQSAGDQTVVWDGSDSQGNSLDPGVYTFAVNAFDVSGNEVGVTTQVQGVVTGVNTAGIEPVLQIGDLEVPVSAVISVQEAA
jgi:flagellar basal-body rod modification protein FlgD